VRKVGLTGFTNRGRHIRIGHGAHFWLKRDQLLLLHEAADDYVGSDNPVRFIVSSTATAPTKLRGAPEIVAALARNHIQNDSLFSGWLSARFRVDWFSGWRALNRHSLDHIEATIRRRPFADQRNRLSIFVSTAIPGEWDGGACHALRRSAKPI